MTRSRSGAQDALIRASDVAQLLGVSVGAVYDMARRPNGLPHFRVGAKGGAVRFSPQDVLAYQEARRVEVRPKAAVSVTGRTVRVPAPEAAAVAKLASMFKALGIEPKTTRPQSQK